MAELSLRGLTKRFGKMQQAAVDNLQLDVSDGEFLALLGPSGCGKTTTLRMIAGFVEPTEGSIAVGGHTLSSAAGVVPPAERRMSMLFQSYALWPHMTIYDNVAFGLKMRRTPSASIKARVQEVLAAVRLDNTAGRYPGELSGGQQQRIALARAVVVQPETLLLDEPLSNLDASLREEMRFEIRRLHDQFGITSVYVTHDLSEAMVTSDRIAIMNEGRLEQVGTPTQIYDEPRTKFVAAFVGTNNVLDCRLEADGAQVGGLQLKVAPDNLRRARQDDARAIGIRPHDIELHSRASAPVDSANVFPARVRQQTYLGDSRDYMIDLDGAGVSLRVITRSDRSFPPGSDIYAQIRPASCRFLAER